MADGKTIEEKLYEVLTADVTLLGLLGTDVNTNPSIYIAKKSPRGVAYPSVNFEWISMNSKEKLTAEGGMINFYINQDPETSEQYSTFNSIRVAIINLLNRNIGEPLTEINVPLNEGLRVVSILKTRAEFKYREEQDKFVSILQFTVIKGEDEDFTTDYGNWTCS
jgi:hypothetical protein